MTKFTHAAAAVLMLISPTFAAADDDALYGEPIPADAAFVRWLNTPSDQVKKAFGYDFSGLVDGTEYVVISAGLLNNVESGAFISVVAQDGDGHDFILEPKRSDRSKVSLLLLNGSESAASLVANGDSIDVIKDVAAGDVGIRAVNPISASLEVKTGDNPAIVATFDVALKRGEDLTFAVLPNGVALIPTTFGTVIAAD